MSVFLLIQLMYPISYMCTCITMGLSLGKSTILISILVVSLAYYGCMFVNINYEMCRIINAPLKDVFSFMYMSENLPQYHPLA